MRRIAASAMLFLSFVSTGSARAAPAAARPAVTAISHIAVYARDLAASDHFYGYVLGGTKAPDPEDPAGVRYHFGPQQFVEVLPAPANLGPSMLAHVAYRTAGAGELRRYLSRDPALRASPLRSANDGSRWFSIVDPEGNEAQFVQPGRSAIKASEKAVGTRLIHVGHLVRSRSAEDRLYRDLLGFRPYWFGAMREGAVDWVSQQVPDGRDWLEYMLVGSGSTTPAERVDARLLGVLNHVSIAVPNMEAAMTRLHAQNRLAPRFDGPSMGRDGKWQANLYDPDGTRVELMEYHAVMKPCCSPFTAPDPTP